MRSAWGGAGGPRSESPRPAIRGFALKGGRSDAALRARKCGLRGQAEFWGRQLGRRAAGVDNYREQSPWGQSWLVRASTQDWGLEQGA